MPRIAFGGIQKLASNQAGKEEGVDSQSDNLQLKEAWVRARHWAPGLAPQVGK